MKNVINLSSAEYVQSLGVVELTLSTLEKVSCFLVKNKKNINLSSAELAHSDKG